MMMLSVGLSMACLSSLVLSSSHLALLLSLTICGVTVTQKFNEVSMVIGGSWWICDQLSVVMVALSLLVSVWALGAIAGNTLETKLLTFLTMVLTLVLVLIFSASSLLIFYFLFEASLVPITLIILGWGYQPERFPAALIMFLYTLIGSLPLLVILVFFSKTMTNMMSFSIIALSWKGLSILSAFFLLGFLAKFPMFVLHLWLPKAHVEAPMIGSMILAAILLKLGGYGIWRFIAFVPNSETITFIQIFSMTGAAVIALICVRQLDLKVLIAYSSVSHMGLAICALLLMAPFSFQAALFMMVAHGASSSGMFFGANLLYNHSHSRNLLLMGGSLTLIPSFSLMWMALCGMNMAAPPSVNLLAEIFCVNSFISSIALTFMFSVSAFFAAAYSLIAYSQPIQGQINKAGVVSEFSSLKDLSILISHIWFGVLLIAWLI